MSLPAALAAAVLGERPCVAVTGREPGPLEPLIQRVPHLVVPGPAARLAAAAGVALGGRRGVVAVGTPLAPPPVGGALLAVTDAPEVAAEALGHGWTVLVPATATDVAPLLGLGPDRALLLVGRAAALGDGPLPTIGVVRTWRDGGAVTLVASGPNVTEMLAIAAAMDARDLAVSALEVPVLWTPAQRPLLGGAVLAGPATAGATLAAGRWPARLLRPVVRAGDTPRQRWEAVLAALPAGAV